MKKILALLLMPSCWVFANQLTSDEAGQVKITEKSPTAYRVQNKASSKLPEKFSEKVSLSGNFDSLAEFVGRFQGLTGVKTVIAGEVNSQSASIENINDSREELLNQAAKSFGAIWTYDSVNDCVVFSYAKPNLPVTKVVASSQKLTVNNAAPQRSVTRATSVAIKANAIKANAVNEQNKNSDSDSTSNVSARRPKASANLPSSRVWQLKKSDGDLHSALARWAEEAGWSLDWKVQASHEINYPLTISGSFEGALNEVLRATQGTDVPLRAAMYTNKVVRITSAEAVND